MNQPGTSTESEVISNTEGNHSMKLLQRLIRKVDLEIGEQKNDAESNLQGGIPLTDPVSRTLWYTGMHRHNLEKMLAFQQPLRIEHKDIERQIIHNELISMYLIKKCIPTMTQLYDALLHLLPNYADLDYFATELISMGYVFHRFSGRRNLYVMEKKSVTFERYKYLKKIQQYRKNKTSVVYIGAAQMTEDKIFVSYKKNLETGKTKSEQRFFFTVTENEIKHVNVVNSISSMTLKSWLINYVLHDLPSGCVCVLDDLKVYREKLQNIPTLNSVKMEMVEWLMEHDIPCDMSMTKSELLDLVKTCTDENENTYVIDNIVKTYHHTLLWLPQCINRLSIIYPVLHFLNINILANFPLTTIDTAFECFCQAQLNIFSEQIHQEELRFLKEDLEVDNVLDELVRTAKMENLIDEDNKECDMVMPTFSDSD